MSGFILRSRDVHALLTALDRLHEPAADATDFPTHLFGVLAELLPGTAVSLDFVDFANHRAESHVASYFMTPAQAAEIEAVVREFIWQNPVGAYLAAGRPAAVVQPTDLISQRQFRRTDLYHLAFRPAGVEYQIVAGLNWSGGYGGLVVNRPRSRNFTAREVELVARLRPHVERIYVGLRQLADLRQRLARAQASLAAAGHIVHPAVWPAGLTAREKDVFHWVGEGKRNGEIALILGISARTVEKHVEHLFAKFGVENRTAMAAIARDGHRPADAASPA